MVAHAPPMMPTLGETAAIGLCPNAGSGVGKDFATDSRIVFAASTVGNFDVFFF